MDKTVTVAEAEIETNAETTRKTDKCKNKVPQVLAGNLPCTPDVASIPGVPNIADVPMSLFSSPSLALVSYPLVPEAI